MSNYHFRNTVAKLRKDMSQTANTMLDMRAFAEKQWKNSMISTDKNQYIMEQRMAATESAVAKQTEVFDAVLTMLDQLLAMQSKQGIDIVKANKGNLRTNAPIAEEAAKNETSVSSAAPEWLKDIKVMDPSTYTRNGRIYYRTIGMSPLDIQYNEFDIELISCDGDADWLADSEYLMDRWSTFCQQCKTYTNSTLGEFIRGYAKRRGLEVEFKQRGRKLGSKNNTNMEAN